MSTPENTYTPELLFQENTILRKQPKWHDEIEQERSIQRLYTRFDEEDLRQGEMPIPTGMNGLFYILKYLRAHSFLTWT